MIALAIAAVLLVVLFFFMVFPRVGRRAAAFENIRFAHRGLHGNGVTENTAEAFRLATENGYAMEFDVHLSSDKIAVVTHDYDLKRVFGRDEKVASLTADELKEIGVPTLTEVLGIVGGKVPLLIEIKGETPDTSVCEVTAEILDKYDGKWCMESFNPLYVRWFRLHRPKVVRGQLSRHFTKGDTFGQSVMNYVLRFFLSNCLCRPDFVAYNCEDDDVMPRLLRLLGASLFAWTVRSAEDEVKALRHYDSIIFEHYRP